jgi:UDPglucose--hexose-1-phosphate uridylyltransferase
MTELRQDPYTNEWVIIAAERPNELQADRPRRQRAKYEPGCPFCAGNEQQTPPDLYVLPDAKGSWAIRVVPNKFAALTRGVDPVRKIEGLHRMMCGGGIHDVIIEMPDHSIVPAFYTDEHFANVLRIYKTCFGLISSNAAIADVTIFKNCGGGAGTSLEHSHAQVIGTPVVSSHTSRRLAEAIRHYDQTGECIFCSVLHQELTERARIILESEHFVALEPYASAVPFLTHVTPRRHMASFGQIEDAEIRDLASVLSRVLRRLYKALRDPDYNYTIRTAPALYSGVSYYHWYLSISPRLAIPAGLELGSGMSINAVPPESAAELLRNIDAAAVELPFPKPAVQMTQAVGRTIAPLAKTAEE